MLFTTKTIVIAFLIGAISGWAWKEDTFYANNQQLESSLQSCQASKWANITHFVSLNTPQVGYDFTKSE